MRLLTDSFSFCTTFSGFLLVFFLFLFVPLRRPLLNFYLCFGNDFQPILTTTEFFRNIHFFRDFFGVSLFGKTDKSINLGL